MVITKGDLVAMILSNYFPQKYYSDPIANKAGSYTGGFVDEWTWDAHELKKLSTDDLMYLAKKNEEKEVVMIEIRVKCSECNEDLDIELPQISGGDFLLKVSPCACQTEDLKDEIKRHVDESDRVAELEDEVNDLEVKVEEYESMIDELNTHIDELKKTLGGS